MKLQLLLCVLFLGGLNAAAQVVYAPPGSAAAVDGVPFASARLIGARFSSRFRECDTSRCGQSSIHRHSRRRLCRGVGVTTGDIAAVVFNGKAVFSLVADSRPKCKIGEGSIQLHEELGYKVCLARNSRQECTRLRNTSIAKDVLYFIFPRSKVVRLTPANARQRIADEGTRLFNALIGAPR